MLRINLQLFAHKKGMGSTKNGHPGLNVGIGSDDTLFSKINGILRFERFGKTKKKASVYEVLQRETIN